MYSSLKKAFNEILEISEEDWSLFESIIETVQLKKKEYLLREGQNSRGIYFLSEGALRTFHIRDGREINTSFNFEKDFLSELESITNNLPSKSSIQAIEDSTVFYIDKQKLLELYEKSDFYQKLGRMILEQLTISQQKYSSLLISYSPKERYLQILENYPNIINRVPLQYLASYLGISRESLSRIRKRVS